ncbi:MAG: hypothetical protein WBJ68_07105, partial [Candidatus Dechloromonas phosphoritropha]
MTANEVNEKKLVVRSINIFTIVPLIAMIVLPFDVEVIMGRTSGRAALLLTDEQRSRLSELAASRTAPVREAERAGVLLKYAQGVS